MYGLFVCRFFANTTLALLIYNLYILATNVLYVCYHVPKYYANLEFCNLSKEHKQTHIVHHSCELHICVDLFNNKLYMQQHRLYTRTHTFTTVYLENTLNVINIIPASGRDYMNVSMLASSVR